MEFRNIYDDVLKEQGKPITDPLWFADADWAGCTTSMRSTSGVVCYYRGTPIMWSSKRQTIIATSSAESEVGAIHDCVLLSKSLGFQHHITEYHSGSKSDLDLPMILNDNKSALEIVGKTVATKRSKHMLLRHAHVTQFAKSMAWVSSGLNLADGLTKGTLSRNQYFQMFYPSMYDPSEHTVFEIELNTLATIEKNYHTITDFELYYIHML
jgi:hypothetical protein